MNPPSLRACISSRIAYLRRTVKRHLPSGKDSFFQVREKPAIHEAPAKELRPHFSMQARQILLAPMGWNGALQEAQRGSGMRQRLAAGEAARRRAFLGQRTVQRPQALQSCGVKESTKSAPSTSAASAPCGHRRAQKPQALQPL